MGSPELPEDPGDDILRPPIHINRTPVPSDDSDNESTVSMGGYQPLPMDEGPDSGPMRPDSPPMHVTLDGDEDLMISVGAPSLPQVESVDAEVERQVWSEPRPQELQIELDTVRSEQIMNAMARFTLPSMAVPQWAVGIPEELWKEELLQRIRQRKEPSAVKQTTQTD